MASSEDESGSDGSNSPTTSVGKLLGIRPSSLRFRHHGLKQKPHLILRRVEEDSDDLTDDGESNRHHVVRFSLFAMKRIDVKPGKELLLCVATDEEAFKDAPLVFEAEDAVSAAEKDLEDATGDVVHHDGSVTAPLEHVVPPKMRRTWTKKTEVSPFSSGPILAQVSVGMQTASKETSSKGVEARPERHSISVQANAITATTSVQTNFASSPANTAQPSEGALESPLTTPPSSTSHPASLELLQETPSSDLTDLPEEPEHPQTRHSKRKQRDKDRKNAKRRRLRAEKREALTQLPAPQLGSEWDLQGGGDEGHDLAKDEELVDVDPEPGFLAQPPQLGDGPSIAEEEVKATTLGVLDFVLQVKDRCGSPLAPQANSDGSLSPMELGSPSSSAFSSPATSYFPASLPTTQSSLSTGSAPPTPTIKGGPICLHLKGPLSTQSSSTAQPDGDLDMLSPLTPLPSLDGSDSSLSSRPRPIGPAPATSSVSGQRESPGYTSPASTPPELPVVPTAQRNLDPTLKPSSSGPNPLREGKDLDHHGEPQRLSPNVEQEAKVSQTSAAKKGSVDNTQSHDLFDSANLTRRSTCSIPDMTMFNPMIVKGSVQACQATEAIDQCPIVPSTTQQLPKKSLSRNMAGWQAISGSSGSRTPPCSSLTSSASPSERVYTDPLAIPTGPRTLAGTKEGTPFSPALVPFEPRHTHHPVPGSLSNPLGIGPSKMPASMRKAMSGVAPPTGPRALQASSCRKPVVIGTGWSAGKGGMTLAPSDHGGEKKKLVAKGSTSSGVTGDRKALDTLFDHSTPPPPSEPPPPPPPADTPPTLPSTPLPPLAPTPPHPPSKWQSLGAPKFVPAKAATGASSETGQPCPTLPTSAARAGPCVPSSSRLDGLTKPPFVLSATLVEPRLPEIMGGAGAPSEMASPVIASPVRAPSPHDRFKPRGAPPLAENSRPLELVKEPRAPLATTLHGFANSPATCSTSQPTSAPLPSVSPSPSLSTLPHHPSLPAKPSPIVSQASSYRGVKRDRPFSPENSGHPLQSSSVSGGHQRGRASSPPRRRARPNVRCPTIKSSATKRLQGDGEPYMQTVSFSSDGSHFVLGCSDKTVRVWSTKDKIELARLLHHSPIVNAFWLEGDRGVIVLTTDGLVSEWERTGDNAWKWVKILNAGKESGEGLCFAYAPDRIAVAFPRLGVKVWILSKGNWQAQRSILRQNVTAIKFMEGGQALLGGTLDGTLWSCEVPNGTLRACAFLKNKIISLDLCPSGTHGLVGFSSGGAILVGGLRQAESKGNVESVYTLTKESDGWSGRNEYGASLATQGQAIVFGTVDSCALVWDRKKGTIVYGLEHDEDEVIQVTAAVDSVGGREGCMLTGTRNGQLCWWALPVAAGQGEGTQTKKQKVEP